MARSELMGWGRAMRLAGLPLVLSLLLAGAWADGATGAGRPAGPPPALAAAAHAASAATQQPTARSRGLLDERRPRVPGALLVKFQEEIPPTPTLQPAQGGLLPRQGGGGSLVPLGGGGSPTPQPGGSGTATIPAPQGSSGTATAPAPQETGGSTATVPPPGAATPTVPGALRAGEAAVIAEHGLAHLRAIPSLRMHLLQVQSGNEIAAARRLQADPRVVYAEPDYLIRRANHLVPTDPLFGTNQQNLTVIGMPDAWHVTTGANSVVVAVVDQGADPGHPDLDGRIANLTGSGFPGSDHVFLTPGSGFPACAATTPEDDGWLATTDPFTHGTHVSGIVAARSTIAGGPSVGIAGVAPGARVAPLKALDCTGNGRFSDVAAAIVFAANNGARVVNLSLSSDGDEPSCTAGMQDALDAAHARGTLLVAAVGNDGNGNRTIPSVCDHVVGVAATDNADARASFSQFNSTVDLSAPGVGIAGPARFDDGTRGWVLGSGTSQAAPHVAGCAALVWSAAPALGVDQVDSVLRGTSLDLGSPGRDDQFGVGRLRCGAAVVAATGGAIPTPVPSATPTRTPTPTNTSTRSPTPTATASAAVTSTPTQTATPAPTTVPVPGGGFTAQSLGGGIVRLSWGGGSGHTALELQEQTAGSTAVIPLTVDQTSVTRTFPMGAQASGCWQLIVRGLLGELGRSNLLCVVAGLAAANSPDDISITLTDDVAQITWVGPPGATAWTATVIELSPSGQLTLTTTFQATSPSVTDNTGGQFRCYYVQGPGSSDWVCAWRRAAGALAATPTPVATPTGGAGGSPTATATATPTATGVVVGSPTATPTRSPTAPPSATPTRTATPGVSPSATPTSGALLGDGFTVQSLGGGVVQLSWAGGSGASTFDLLETTAGPVTATIPLDGAETSITRNLAGGSLVSACWQLIFRGPEGAEQGRSGTLCVVAGLAAASGPDDIGVSLSGNLAQLRWVGPPGASAWTVTATTYSATGQVAGVTTFQVTSPSATHDTRGALTCYYVQAPGSSDWVCANP